MPRVLIVDDEPRILSALQRCLRREDFELETAENATVARRVLESSAVDVVLSDHKMPGESGVDLLGWIAKNQPQTMRILMSGWTGEISESALGAAELFEVIAKPWDEESLRQTIRDALAQRSARATS